MHISRSLENETQSLLAKTSCSSWKCERSIASSLFPGNCTLYCIIGSYWSWPGMLFVLWITACRLMSNPTHLNPLTIYWPRTTRNPDKAITPMWLQNSVVWPVQAICWKPFYYILRGRKWTVYCLPINRLTNLTHSIQDGKTDEQEPV